jgi:hypothetical protein
MALGIVSCGTINSENKVVVLWKNEATTNDPNSLMNAFDRAMYIENISYEYKGAKGNADEQLAQAKAAIDNGCAVLAVELVDGTIAAEIVELAKAKEIPVVFFNCAVADEVLASYDKCFLVASDTDKIAKYQSELILDYIKENHKDIDKDGDKKISYVNYNVSEEVAELVNAELKKGLYDGGLLGTGIMKKKIDLELVSLGNSIPKDLKDLKKVELIITGNDKDACDALVKLQEKDYNTDKLATKFVPIFTVGSDFDYKAHVVANRPALSADMIIDEEKDSQQTIDAKDKKIKELCKEYYKKNKFLVDLTNVDEVDVDDMIYTTTNIIGDGRISGTVTEDKDTISLTVAAICRNLIKNKSAFDGIDKELVDGSKVKISYIKNP